MRVLQLACGKDGSNADTVVFKRAPPLLCEVRLKAGQG